MIKYSVVIPASNIEAYVPSLISFIDTVLRYRDDVEFIIINDGSVPIIGVFPMTITRELTGHGVNNDNYYNGGKYRSIIMEVCSEKDVIIADVMGELGQIGVDNTQLRDNVHVNSAFNVLISKSFSNSIKYKISNDF